MRETEHSSRVTKKGSYGTGENRFRTESICPFCNFLNTDEKNMKGQMVEVCDHLVEIIGGCGVSAAFVFENKGGAKNGS